MCRRVRLWAVNGVAYVPPMRTLFRVVGLLLAGPVLPLFAQELDYPPSVFNGDVLDVSTVAGVDKTGASDSSVGLQTAINMLCADRPTDKPRQRTLYFPTGTYTISKPIDAVASVDATGTLTSGSTVVTMASTTNVAAGEWVTGTNIPANTTVAVVNSSTQITLGNAATGSGATALHFAINLYRLHIAGQSESGTIIRASQSFTGAMIKTEGDNAQQSGGAPLSPAGNTFDNSICNLTVDANGFSVSGIDFLSNNTGNVRNVTVMGGGHGQHGHPRVAAISRPLHPRERCREQLRHRHRSRAGGVLRDDGAHHAEQPELGGHFQQRQLRLHPQADQHQLERGARDHQRHERPPRPARFVGDLHRRHDDGGRDRQLRERFAVRRCFRAQLHPGRLRIGRFESARERREYLGQRDAAHEHGILHASGADAGPAEFRNDVTQPADPGNAGGDRTTTSPTGTTWPPMARW